MGKAQDSYSLDDLQSDTGHLGHLIDTIADVMFDGVDYVAPNDTTGTRMRGVDRLAGLVWILRDQIEVLNKNISTNYDQIAGREKKVAATVMAMRPTTARDVLMELEPPVLDANVATMIAMTIWDAAGQKLADGSLKLSEDEREQMQRALGDVLTQVTHVVDVYRTAERASRGGRDE